jgi:hypothetical protein
VLQLTHEHETPVTGTQHGSLSLITQIFKFVGVGRSSVSTVGYRQDGQWIRDRFLIWGGGQEIFFICVNHLDQLWCPQQACFALGTTAEHARTWSWHFSFILHKGVRMYRDMRWPSMYFMMWCFIKCMGNFILLEKCVCVRITHSLWALSSWDISLDPHSKGLQFSLGSDMCVYFSAQTFKSSPLQSKHLNLHFYSHKYCSILDITLLTWTVI